MLSTARSRICAIVFLACFLLGAKSSLGQSQVALQPGATIPAIALKDQAGRIQSFATLKGPNGLLLIFSRSADWCPLCKSQLIDFESSRTSFESKGIRVASVTYDSPEILKTFSERKNIHFELLSDPDSKLIDAFGVRNLEVTGTQVGIAIPNYYIIDSDGVIRYRWEENTLDNRVTANYFYETLYGSGTANTGIARQTAHTPHLRIRLTQSDSHSAPGARIRLAVELDPGRYTHLYAPGAETNGYRAVKLILEPSELYTFPTPAYPKAHILEFPKLHERVPVFESKTIVTQDVTAVRSSASMVEFLAHPELAIRGVLEYQACTNTTCYPPQKVPVEWMLKIRPDDLDSVRVAADLQRR